MSRQIMVETACSGCRTTVAMDLERLEVWREPRTPNSQTKSWTRVDPYLLWWWSLTGGSFTLRFECPLCRTHSSMPLSSDDLHALANFLDGVRRRSTTVHTDIRERPPFTVEDLIDFHFQLERISTPEELTGSGQ